MIDIDKAMRDIENGIKQVANDEFKKLVDETLLPFKEQMNEHNVTVSCFKDDKGYPKAGVNGKCPEELHDKIMSALNTISKPA